MKRIDMVKFGFVRSAEDDFTDDGTRFTCYRAGKVRVSKTTYQGEVFISGHASIDNRLPYDIYHNLPHYSSLDNLNGVMLANITEEDLTQLYNDCVEYEKEYEEKARTTEYPTLDELREKQNQIRAWAMSEYVEIKKQVFANFEKFLQMSKTSPYYFNTIMKWMEELRAKAQTEVRVEPLLNTAYSFDFMKNSTSNHSWYYTNCIEIIVKVMKA